MHRPTSIKVLFNHKLTLAHKVIAGCTSKQSVTPKQRCQLWKYPLALYGYLYETKHNTELIMNSFNWNCQVVGTDVSREQALTAPPTQSLPRWLCTKPNKTKSYWDLNVPTWQDTTIRTAHLFLLQSFLYFYKLTEKVNPMKQVIYLFIFSKEVLSVMDYGSARRNVTLSAKIVLTNCVKHNWNTDTVSAVMSSQGFTL